MALVFVVWAECVTSTTVHRWKDVVEQVGAPAFIVYNIGFLGAMVLGTGVAYAVGPEVEASIGFGIFIAFTIIAVAIARTPETKAPLFWGNLALVSRFWCLAFHLVSNPSRSGAYSLTSNREISSS